MIVFDLACPSGHRFEGWFGSSSDYADQQERGLLACPQCGSAEIEKALMAPAVPTKGNQRKAVDSGEAKAVGTSMKQAVKQALKNPPPELVKAMEAIGKAQSKALEGSTWVGDKFAEQSREMHYGERDETSIHGKASPKEAKELLDEGIAVAPLPLPITPPEEVN